MKYLFIVFFTLLSSALFAQSYTAKQLYDEYHQNNYTFENKYLGKTFTVTGKIRSIKKGIPGLNEANAVFITATGYENFISCQFPLNDTLPLLKLKADDIVTVTGTCKMIARDAFVMKDCSFSTSTSAPAAETKKVSANIPLGLYHVYQGNGSSFDFQYKLNLNSYTSYKINGVKGTCTYNPKTKVIRFTSGKFKGFTGVYRPVNPDNEKDPPTIVIDATGKLPDLKNQVGKAYLLAYLQ